MDARPELGRSGEDLAVRMYADLGYDVIERNFRCREGEIDVIAARGATIVFCEVKTRRGDRWGSPWEAVHPRKQARVRRLAARWLSEKRMWRSEIRFDVVSVIVRDGRAEVRHIPDAF